MGEKVDSSKFWVQSSENSELSTQNSEPRLTRPLEMASCRGEAGIMPQDMVSIPCPLKRCCEKCRIGLARGDLLRVCNCLCELCDWFSSLGPSKEPAMNGTLGFQAILSSISRSPSYCFRHARGHQSGNSFWHIVCLRSG